MNPLLYRYAESLLSVIFLTIVFYAFERIRPAEAGQRFRDRAANYAYLPFGVGCILLLKVILTPWNDAIIRLTDGGGLVAGVFGRLAIAEVAFGVCFAIGWDVWQYWIHRAQHRWPILWETHKFHHSDAAMNSSTQGRHQFLSHVVYTVAYAPMFLLFGGRTPHFIAGVLMFRVWGFVNHANVRLSFGPLTSLVAGPQWHRIHHSVEPEHRDRNFAAFFPFIDRMFGTYYAPAPDEYPATEAEGFLMQATISPFAGAWRSFRARANGVVSSKSSQTGSTVPMPHGGPLDQEY
jgi:sterol desaturase/sphingolipid hydroxylase (fatty acid hydroxylase superfamily)